MAHTPMKSEMKSKAKRRKTAESKRGVPDQATAVEWLKGQGIEEIECMVPDLAGVARGKIMPVKKFMTMGVMNLPLAVFYQTIAGDYPELDGGVTAVEADTDIFLKPEFSTLTTVPWAHDPSGRRKPASSLTSCAFAL